MAKDFETSQLMGIKINSVISITFIIGSALAAIGSMLYFTTYPAIVPTAGAMPGLKPSWPRCSAASAPFRGAVDPGLSHRHL